MPSPMGCIKIRLDGFPGSRGRGMRTPLTSVNSSTTINKKNNNTIYYLAPAPRGKVERRHTWCTSCPLKKVLIAIPIVARVLSSVKPRVSPRLPTHHLPFISSEHVSSSSCKINSYTPEPGSTTERTEKPPH